MREGWDNGGVTTFNLPLEKSGELGRDEGKKWPFVTATICLFFERLSWLYGALDLQLLVQSVDITNKVGEVYTIRHVIMFVSDLCEVYTIRHVIMFVSDL